jgi:hypothetical protein
MQTGGHSIVVPCLRRSHVSYLPVLSCVFLTALFSVETISRLMIELLMNWKGSRRKQSLHIRGAIPVHAGRKEKKTQVNEEKCII